MVTGSLQSPGADLLCRGKGAGYINRRITPGPSTREKLALHVKERSPQGGQVFAEPRAVAFAHRTNEVICNQVFLLQTGMLRTWVIFMFGAMAINGPKEKQQRLKGQLS